MVAAIRASRRRVVDVPTPAADPVRVLSAAVVPVRPVAAAIRADRSYLTAIAVNAIRAWDAVDAEPAAVVCWRRSDRWLTTLTTN